MKICNFVGGEDQFEFGFNEGFGESEFGDKETLGNQTLMILFVVEIFELEGKDLVVIILLETLIGITLVELEEIFLKELKKLVQNNMGNSDLVQEDLMLV